MGSLITNSEAVSCWMLNTVDKHGELNNIQYLKEGHLEARDPSCQG